MTATRPGPTDAQVEAPSDRAVAAMPSTALTSIEREVFPDNLGGTVQGVKAEWFSRGYETALSSSVIGDLIAEALAPVREVADHWHEFDNDNDEGIAQLFAALSPTPADGTTSERSEA